MPAAFRSKLSLHLKGIKRCLKNIKLSFIVIVPIFWKDIQFFSGKISSKPWQVTTKMCVFPWRGLLVESLDFASTDAASGGD